jgi:hypothetical protein
VLGLAFGMLFEDTGWQLEGRMMNFKVRVCTANGRKAGHEICFARNEWPQISPETNNRCMNYILSASTIDLSRASPLFKHDGSNKILKMR